MLLLQEAAEGTASPLSGPLQETAEGSETGERAAKIRKGASAEASRVRFLPQPTVQHFEVSRAEVRSLATRPNPASALGPLSENGVRLAQKMQVGPCITVRTQLEKAEVGPISGPTWRVSHLRRKLWGLELWHGTR
jgi:hypothetical protein